MNNKISHNEIVETLIEVRDALKGYDASPIIDSLDKVAKLIEAMSKPNPDGAKFYWWLLAVGVHETWVEDGADFTDEDAHDMLTRRFPHALGRELKAKVLGRPADTAVAAIQGYQTVKAYRADRK